MELTEKFLVSMCGWPVFKEARAIHAAGRVSEAAYEPPLLKGKVESQGKTFFTGLKIRNAIDVENLCPCRDSRGRGIICAHAVAVGIEVLHPAEKKPAAVLKPVPSKQNSTAELPRIRLSLEGSLRHLEAEISFEYSQPGAANHEAEAAALRELIACGFEDFRGKAALKGEAAVARFFSSALPRLREKWTVQEGERFRHVTRDIVRIEPRFALKEKEDGWLDFHIHFTAGSEAVLSHQEIQKLLQSGSPQLRLKDGRVAVPDADLVSDLEEVLRDAEPRQERGAYRVPGFQRAYLEACISGWTGADGSTSGFAPLKPGPLHDVLRPYQTEGAGWLLFLAQKNSGGLLADEMGLGKTIQALAMMESLPGPHLVVCPSSLVWNWCREAAKFVRGMKVLAIEGGGREERFDKIASSDIVVTSYALLRRDIERYKDRRFSTVVLDEAQHIKNPDSQNAKAACALKADARFILTGTPLENSLRDLWSLFDFLLPGYLGTRKDFQDRYEKPLLEGERGPLWERLNRRVRPWMLRRKKSDLLPELPDKIEQIVEVELTPAQKAVYTQLQIAARAEVDAMKESGGAARMRVLTALLRLRQACCDLRLLGSEAPGASAKLDALLELVGEAVDGGHRVLVFSQFTAMLDLIAPALDEAGFSWCRLDGSTKDRASVVEKFQSDPAIPVFLISLKAGGTGLNLTAADTVIHFDPWWNPAVEAQATDRAHRIGQTSVVTSIKLIARDTVEHRVIAMQEKKRALISGLLDAETPSLTSRDWEELLA
ncbi:MAG: SNF2-related protein [Verrucomicrobia bacterium]|nr:SNF2-related protein [Verrucomicrobiota bacterium]